jgi:hypothetical protein
MPVNRFVAGLAPTPVVRSGQPRTHTRKCGSQPAHQSLITDVLQVPSPPLRDHLPVPLPSGCVRATRYLTADIRAVSWPHRLASISSISRAFASPMSQRTSRKVVEAKVRAGIEKHLYHLTEFPAEHARRRPRDAGFLKRPGLLRASPIERRPVLKMAVVGPPSGHPSDLLSRLAPWERLDFPRASPPPAWGRRARRPWRCREETPRRCAPSFPA